MSKAHSCIHHKHSFFCFFLLQVRLPTVKVFLHFDIAAEVQAIASMIEKQAQIVVKTKEVSEESKKRKEALLAQYANITDEEEYP